jgi:hypothetical protein
MVKPSKTFNKLFKKQLHKDLIKVKELILEEPEKFDMRVFSLYVKDCGTARCIGGWLAHLMNKRGHNPIYMTKYYTRGGEKNNGGIYLDSLFYADWPPYIEVPLPMSHTTPRQAAKAIDLFIEKTEDFVE